MAKDIDLKKFLEDNKDNTKERIDNKILSLKQTTFCKEYVRNGGNATEAAKAAGYAGSYETLRRIASENMSKLHIKKRIELEKARITSEAGSKFLTADDVLQRLAAIAENADTKDSDKIKALELLGKYYSIFTDKLTVQQSTDYASIINNSRQQLKTCLAVSSVETHEKTEKQNVL